MSQREFDDLREEMRKLQSLRFTDKVRWAMALRPEVLGEKADELRRATEGGRFAA